MFNLIPAFSEDSWSAYEKWAWLHKCFHYRGVGSTLASSVREAVEEGIDKFILDLSHAGISSDVLPLGAWATLALYVTLLRRCRHTTQGQWSYVLRLLTASGGLYVAASDVESSQPLPLQAFSKLLRGLG